MADDEPLIKTEYEVIRPGDRAGEVRTIDWPRSPGLGRLKALIEPLLGKDEPLEHVSVLHLARRADMFVSELGHLERTTRRPLPINGRATDIYRANWLSKHPDADPASLPRIAGTAVLFRRIVWS